MAGSNQLIRVVLGWTPHLGDLYNSILDEPCSRCCLGSDPVHNVDVTALNKTTCQIGSANTIFDVCLGFGLPPEQLKEQVNLIGCKMCFEAMKESTHVVCSIQYGYRATVVVQIDRAEGGEEIREVQRKLTIVRSFILGEDGVTEADVKETGYKQLFNASFRMNTSEQNSLLAFAKLLKRLPLQKDIKEEGTHVKMSPTSLIQSLYGLEESMFAKEMNAANIEEVRKYFFDFDEAVKSLKRVQKMASRYCSLFPNEIEIYTMDLLLRVNDKRRDAQEVFWKGVTALREGAQESMNLKQFLDDEDVFSPDDIWKCIGDLSYVFQKPEEIKELKRLGVTVVSDADGFEELSNISEVFVLFACLCSPDQYYEANKSFFLETCSKFKRAFVDSDLIGHLQKVKDIKESSVRLYRDGICVEEDVFRFYELLKNNNVLKNIGEFQTERRPIRRVLAQLVCPGGKSRCSAEVRVWTCYACETAVEYGFDSHFYCECGRYPVMNAAFFCNDAHHGNSFATFDTEDDIHSAVRSIPPCMDCNVLLLGESGCGKSTWINGIINYLSADNLFEAAKRELRYVIPSSFTMEDNDKQVKTICVGSSKNEVFKTGQSATQRPRSYTFNFGNRLMRFIDVPGIGDVRGASKDRENLDALLRFIEKLPELHAICILLPPNTSRLTVTLKYCLNELLAHLHKNATANIVFCFTKTRTTFYRAGESLKTLKSYLDDYHLDIPLIDETMYYFDNEAFRLLCAEQGGVRFPEDERNSYAASWLKSSSETIRLLQHAIAAPAHKMRETVSINEMRGVIERLTPLLAEFSTNIQTNIRLIEENRKEFELLAQKSDNLSSRADVVQVTIERTDIDYPRTVCVAGTCIETRSIPGTDEVQRYYKQTCHDHCFLKGIERERYPDIRLKECWAMNGTQCQQCGCGWDHHMHIYYMQEQKSVSIRDPYVERLIAENADKGTVLTAHLNSLERMKEVHERNYRKLTRYCATFGAFLRSNSIVPYNDAMIEYLDYSITVAKQDAQQTGSSLRVQRLKQFKMEYEEELRILRDESVGVNQISPSHVNRLKEKMFAIPEFGAKIKSALQRRTHMEETENDDDFGELHAQFPLDRFKHATSAVVSHRSVAVSADPSQCCEVQM
ncbi:unnamed protein product [Toxocara canis]|uniref:G domain-containing protein n=1 Tax=Toxocara canis TaxID=6265 RepID=A0A183UA36_TOXCA|nr:unnamed protein product [Toxocara canis]